MIGHKMTFRASHDSLITSERDRDSIQTQEIVECCRGDGIVFISSNQIIISFQLVAFGHIESTLRSWSRAFAHQFRQFATSAPHTDRPTTDVVSSAVTLARFQCYNTKSIVLYDSIRYIFDNVKLRSKGDPRFVEDIKADVRDGLRDRRVIRQGTRLRDEYVRTPRIRKIIFFNV